MRVKSYGIQWPDEYPGTTDEEAIDRWLDDNDDHSDDSSVTGDEEGLSGAISHLGNLERWRSSVNDVLDGFRSVGALDNTESMKVGHHPSCKRARGKVVFCLVQG